MGFTNAVVGGINLVRSAIRSPNYVPGISGWTINKDGSASFNSVTLTGGSLTITTSGQGVFVYSGTPALGNLIASVASAAGTDAFGNSYPAGVGTQSGGTVTIGAGGAGKQQIALDSGNASVIKLISPGGGTVTFTSSSTSSAMEFKPNTSDWGAAGDTPGILAVSNVNSGLANQLQWTLLSTPVAGNIAEGTRNGVGLLMTNDSDDGTSLGSWYIGRMLANATGLYEIQPDIWINRNTPGVIIFDPLYLAASAAGTGATGFGAETWHAATLQNSWANTGGSDPAAQYRQVASPPNSVEIIGSVSGGATGSTIFTLPASYRPAHNLSFPAFCTPSGSTVVPRIAVLTTGAVEVFNYGSGSLIFHAIIPLDA